MLEARYRPGPCPKQRNDKTVSIGKGDLMLCRECDAERRRIFDADQGKKSRAATRPATTRSASASTATSQLVLDEGGAEANVESTDIRDNSDLIGQINTTATLHTLTETKQLIINEMLTYLCFYRNAGNIADIKKTLSCYYLPEEISNAKQVLLNAFNSTLHSTTFATKRRESSARSQLITVLDDIIGACDYLDKAGQLSETQFVAVKLDRLPRCGPEELNLYSVNERQNTLELNVRAMQQKLCDVEININDHEKIQKVGYDMSSFTKKFEEFNSQISAQLDHMQQIYITTTNHMQQTCLKETEQVSTKSGQYMHETPDSVDRSMNIVLFGVDENKDANIWRKKADDVFQSLVGHTVDIVDLFRLGRYSDKENRPRPILIKLRSVWDCRVLLSSSRKLKGTRMFLARDEPVAVRRKTTFERLKRRAELDGKSVCVTDGQLIINGTAEYSLSQGSLRSHYSASING
jgi:small nuclear ribonucleoprotein (snRNP)-like protein